MPLKIRGFKVKLDQESFEKIEKSESSSISVPEMVLPKS
jgi:hypothetical protein